MSTTSKIEWTEKTWNPITGCTQVSAGCLNCYAKRLIETRLKHKPRFKKNGFEVTIHRDRFDQPTRWAKPRMVFVCSMGDLFHEDVPTPVIFELLEVMRSCPRHTFQVLTKRAQRMQQVVVSWTYQLHQQMPEAPWVHHNIWFGVTAENERRLDERLPDLVRTPAIVRFLSLEPLLEPINLGLPGTVPKSWDPAGYQLVGDKIDWVIVGGESGFAARMCDPDWIRDVIEQCRDMDVPVFVKQLGTEWARGRSGARKGGLMSDWPEDLRVREWPGEGRR